MNRPLHPGLLDSCVHCGLCLTACPTFRATGHEAESPRGRLLLMEGALQGRWDWSEAAPHLEGCLGCRACESVCPAGVPYGAALEASRAVMLGEGQTRGRAARWMIRHVLWRRSLLRFAAPLLGLLGPLLRRAAAVPGLPPALGGRLRLVPRVERRSRVKFSASAVPEARRASVMSGCVAGSWFAATETDTCRLLDAAGYRVRRLGSPSCCGALAAHAGETATAERFHAELQRVIQPGERVVATAAGCSAHLAAHPAVETLELTEALVQGPRPLRFRNAQPVVVAYQDACHLRHGQGVVETPRSLLRQAGATVVEIRDAALCCGSAGLYNLEHPAPAAELGRAKAAALLEVRPQVVITANPGCHLQLSAHLQVPGLSVETLPRFLAARL